MRIKSYHLEGGLDRIYSEPIFICLPCLVGLRNSPRQRSAGKADGPAAEGGFLSAQARSFGDLAAEADRKLFRAVVIDPRHVLSRLLPEVKSTSYNLRPWAHCFVLPTKDTRNFIPRMLYDKILLQVMPLHECDCRFKVCVYN